MHIDQLDYDLPARLIAQHPCPERDQSRLLVLRRSDGSLAHHVFRELRQFLEPGDLLVLNDTRVMPARLLGQRGRTGGKWEGLYLRTTPEGDWELLCQTRGRLMVGEKILVEAPAGQPVLRLCLTGRAAGGHWVARPEEAGTAAELLGRFGHVPLPPYIRKGRGDEADRERYQTVYANRAGAVAAPTAGLHFTPVVFDELRRRGIAWAFATLHVGAGTFQPIQVAGVSEHQVQAEWGELPAATAAAVAACKARGRRVVAVGTTTVRILETAGAAGEVRPWSGETALTICPPFTFRVVDALVTNFHLPRSSLLLLVAAFAGVERVLTAYREAVDREYRFYSYGDAMLIL